MLYHVTFTSGKKSLLTYDYGCNNDVDIDDGDDRSTWMVGEYSSRKAVSYYC